MKKFLMYPFKKAVSEIEKNKRLQKELTQSDAKIKIRSFIFASYLFLLIISMMYMLPLYLIIVGIFVTPVAFIPIIPTVITTLIFSLIYTKIYPKTKKNYLESIGYFKKNKENPDPTK